MAAVVMNARGPSLSINHPDRGIDQVITAIKIVNPHCAWESFQCVAVIRGCTNNVHAYCRLPIMIIAVIAAISRAQRFT
jgi:hypothetical protein